MLKTNKAILTDQIMEELSLQIESFKLKSSRTNLVKYLLNEINYLPIEFKQALNWDSIAQVKEFLVDGIKLAYLTKNSNKQIFNYIDHNGYSKMYYYNSQANSAKLFDLNDFVNLIQGKY